MVLERATGHTDQSDEALDRWVESFTWSPDSTRLFFTIEDRGRTILQHDLGHGRRHATPSFPAIRALDDVQFNADGNTS